MDTVSQMVVVEFVPLTCSECSVIFGLPKRIYESRRSDGGRFWCPNGHVQAYIESEVQKLQRQLALTVSQLDQQKAAVREQREGRERDRRDAERRVSAQKAVVTRLKNKAAQGHCPCCDRLFPDLALHMATEHPDFEGRSKLPLEQQG